MRRAWHNVAILVIAQAVMGAQMPLIFTIGGLAGMVLSPDPCFSTLAISMIVLGSAISARPLAALMQHHGRRTGFQVAALAGMLGAGVSALGLYEGSFALYIAGSLLTGVYMAAQGFFRFAATDTAPEDFAPRAISFVMAGGLASAFVALGILRLTDGVSAIPYLYTYAAIVGLNLAGLVLFSFLDIPRPPAARAPGGGGGGRPMAEILHDPAIIVAMICGLVAYALMNLVMTSTPLAMVGCGLSQTQAGNVVFLHVLAMFAPSFVTGHLINRFGAARIVGLGLVILLGAGVVALSGVAVGHFTLSLILLGIGWNFGFIGATTMLTRAHSPAERGRVQGVNVMVVFGGVYLASLASGA
ncbi:MAG: MFS transporter, partial [Paracoccus sp. (in: a-proteobacteria)]|nr:MFS transporter [Paracoccus sp. (in: a-proteobacteria)]